MRKGVQFLMKHTVIESERIVVYLSKSDDNTLTFEARPKCQIKLNRAVKKFVDYASTFDDDDLIWAMDGNEILYLSVEKMASFIRNYDVITFDPGELSSHVDLLEKHSIHMLSAKLAGNNNILASFSFKKTGPDSFSKLFDLLVDFFGMTYMGFIMCDIITLAEKACKYVDLWEDNDEYINIHKNTYYDISVNI